MHGVRRLSGTSTRIESTVQFGDIGFDTPGLGDWDILITNETHGTAPAVSLRQSMFLEKPSHGWPLPITATIKPLDGPPQPLDNAFSAIFSSLDHNFFAIMRFRRSLR